MRVIKDLTTVLGSLAVAWTIVLAVPGVRAVRADEGAEPVAAEQGEAAAEGATCEAGPANGQMLVDSLQRVQRDAIRQLAPQLAQRDTPPGIIGLDNRGFNDPRE